MREIIVGDGSPDNQLIVETRVWQAAGAPSHGLALPGSEQFQAEICSNAVHSLSLPCAALVPGALEF